MHPIKVVLVGDGSVGKSSIIARFVSDGFRQKYAQTIGVDFFEKQVTLRGDQAVTLQIWDIGGQSISSKMLPSYIANAHVVLLAYDVTSRSSLDNVEDWIARVESVMQTGRKPLYYLVGNKADLIRHRQVSDTDHERFWKSHKLAGGFLTSAASGENVARAVYQAAAFSVGIRLSDSELAFHDRVLGVRVEPYADHEHGGRTADADRIEAEDRAAELAKQRREAQRRNCSCRLS